MALSRIRYMDRFPFFGKDSEQVRSPQSQDELAPVRLNSRRIEDALASESYEVPQGLTPEEILNFIAGVAQPQR